MKKAILIKTLFLSMLFIDNILGYSYLYVSDPRNSWWSDQGTIEKAEIHVKPQGVYMDFDIFLTFSARGSSYFSSYDTLEVVYTFELPQGAIIHDSWLWFGDDTLEAKIMDKWTATSIYEGVVKRRRDPSILQKLNDNQYELRIFPMAGNETRKVKMSIMLPVSWNKEKVSTQLLTDLFPHSSYPLEKVDIITWTDDVWKNPLIQGTSGAAFVSSSSALFGSHYKTSIQNQFFSGINSITFNSPAKDGIFLSNYENSEEGIYQLAFLPSALVSPPEGQKVAVLFDYDVSKTNLTINQVLQQTRDHLISNLSERDSFNLIFSNFTIIKASNKWLPADSLTIVNTFNNLSNPLSSYSNLTALISAGIDFIKSNGNAGKIILLSNSSQYGDKQIANKLLNDIMDLMEPIFPFYISDYAQSYYDYYYFNNRSYYNNEYLFSTLSKFTNGAYSRVLDNHTFSEVIEYSMQYMGGSIKSFDLFTRLTSGISYGRYNINNGSDAVYLNNAVLQVGKYKGDIPFEINYSGEYNSEIISEEISLTEDDIFPADSSIEEIWAGIYIQHLEEQNQTNDIITEIIQNSISERVLSLYTAFLCIPEAFLPCEDCEEEENQVTSIEEKLIIGGNVLQAYPNPFSNSITININLDEGDTESITQAAIYSVTGQKIFVFDLSSSQNDYSFIWKGMDADGKNLAAGVYIFILQTDRNIYKTKLIKQ